MSSASTIWRSRLSSALRTAVACAVVGITFLYCPTTATHYLKFPAFSYMTAVLIVGEATLGDSIKGAACALSGIPLGLLMSMLTLCIMQPKHNSAATTALAVAISSFPVAILDSAALITKRIALGQIVIVYVTAFKEAGHGKPVLHPLPVAASTAVGAVASVIALVFPYPRLAYHQVTEKGKLYTKFALERLRFAVNGTCADSSTCMVAWASQAKSSISMCAKLLQNIKLIQGSLQWERSLFKLPLGSREQLETLQSIETPLQGMEMALASATSSAPHKILDQNIKDELISRANQISIKLSQDKSDVKNQILDQNFQSLQAFIPQNLQDLPSLFFLFNLKLLINNVGQSVPSLSSQQDNKVTPTSDDTAESFNKEEPSDNRRKCSTWPVKVSIETFIVALKCSLSLSFAVLFGVIFSNHNGYWSGITVAVAFTPFGDSTFRSASARAHGTALGSFYGLLGSFISQNLMEVRLLLLLPWIVLTSFLHRSRMYGPIGGFAATVSAIILLGRKNYGPPMIFAAQRLTETYIGLCCAVLFELLLQPKRASTLARARLSESFETLRGCLNSLTSPVELKSKGTELRARVNELKKFIADAELEPNFWFQPFPTACYGKIQASLAKMADLLLFTVHGTEILAQESYLIDETINGDLEHFRNLIVTSVKCFEDVIQVKSLARLVMNASVDDIETGKGVAHCEHNASSADGEESGKIVDSFLRHAKEAMERIDEGVNRESKSQVVLCLAAFGFCIGGLMREVKEMEQGIVELVQWENPSVHIKLHEILVKL